MKKGGDVVEFPAEVTFEIRGQGYGGEGEGTVCRRKTETLAP